mgnify:CR=1 FL=1
MQLFTQDKAIEFNSLKSKVSSTIKVYVFENELQLLEEKSIYFKNGFSKEEGIR